MPCRSQHRWHVAQFARQAAWVGQMQALLPKQMALKDRHLEARLPALRQVAPRRSACASQASMCDANFYHEHAYTVTAENLPGLKCKLARNDMELSSWHAMY